jgi:hypothetical protein
MCGVRTESWVPLVRAGDARHAMWRTRRPQDCVLHTRWSRRPQDWVLRTRWSLRPQDGAHSVRTGAAASMLTRTRRPQIFVLRTQGSSTCGQRLLEIFEEVFSGFDAYGHADQVVADA